MLTNDPKQRPLYSGFEALGTRIVGAFISVLITMILAKKYAVGAYVGEGMRNPAMWGAASKIICLLILLLTVLAMAGIWQKDNSRYYGRTAAQRIKMRDYLDIVAHNRPIQMLIVSAATDKLGVMLSNGLLVYVCSNLLMNTALEGKYTIVSLVPVMVAAFIGVGIARKKGLKRNFITGTLGSMVMLVVLLVVKPSAEKPWIWLTLLLVQNCVYCLSSSSVIPMLADCTDYGTYRSGRFVPGMIGTIFSFVDKLLSSLSNLIIGLALTIAGVGDTVIPPNHAMGAKFDTVILLCFCGIPILGHIASLIAMKFYELDDKRMEEIQAALQSRV